MKKTSNYIVLAVIILAVLIATNAFSLSMVSKRTISFIPSDVTELLYSYLEACKKNPDEVVSYTHFETELEREAYLLSPRQILGYEILGAEKVNENLYAFALEIQKEHTEHPKRYYFVGNIEGKLLLMVNEGNIPEDLKSGFNKDRFAFTQDELNGDIPVSADFIIPDIS